MIATLNLNPVVARSLPPDPLTPSLRMSYKVGDGGISVNKAIHRLGGQSLALFTAGGSAGLKLQQAVEAVGIPYRAIRINGSTRQCFRMREPKTGRNFRVGTPSPLLTPAEAIACLTQLKTMPQSVDYLVASGSLPAGLPADFYAQIARIAKARRIRFVLDTVGQPLESALDEGIFLGKISLSELARLTDVDHLEAGQIGEAATRLIKRGNCSIVLVALESGGAVLVTATGQDYVRVPSHTTGVGDRDSLLGGALHALTQAQPPTDTGGEMGRRRRSTAGTLSPQLLQPTDTDRLSAWINQQHQRQRV